jgi:hypothetical protein
MMDELETIKTRAERGVLFAEISAPPMNLIGPALVRDLVTLIQQAEADDSIQVLARLVGRARALEIVLGAEDYPRTWLSDTAGSIEPCRRPSCRASFTRLRSGSPVFRLRARLQPSGG